MVSELKELQVHLFRLGSKLIKCLVANDLA